MSRDAGRSSGSRTPGRDRDRAGTCRWAPGTGTPEIGGFTTHQAQRMVRRLMGLTVVGADLVEVSPPFDPSGQTAWVGMSIAFELLCVLADRVARR